MPASPTAEPRSETPAETETGASKPAVPPTHPAAYPVMSVPVSDPLWRRPALLASALAGLLVGMAAYGVRWARDQVEAYEPSVATAAAVQEPSQETSPSPLPATVPGLATESSGEIEVIEEEDRAGQASAVEVVEPKPAPSVRSKSAPRTKRSPARAPRAKAVSPAPAPQPAPEPAVAETPPEPEPEAEPPKPSPMTLAEAIAEANSEPQAKTQPTSASTPEPEGYTPFDRDSARSALSDAAKAATRCRSDSGPFGSARVAVTFAPNGQTTTAIVQGPPFAGTPVGSCIARTFREARVSPFSGAPVTVRTSVTIF